MDRDELAALAQIVQKTRLDRSWSKERAAREADVSSITYKRVEDGLPVQDAKRAAILNALQITWPLDEFELGLRDEPTWGRGGSVSAVADDGPEFEFLTRVREDLTDEEMDQLMKEARPYLEMLVRDIKNRNRD